MANEGNKMVILMFLPTMLATRANLLVEIIALQQPLAVLSKKRPGFWSGYSFGFDLF
jgi:hypothetical protein